MRKTITIFSILFSFFILHSMSTAFAVDYGGFPIFGQAGTLNGTVIPAVSWSNCFLTGNCANPSTGASSVYPVRGQDGQILMGCYELRGKQLVRVSDVTLGANTTCPASPNNSPRLRIMTYARQVCPTAASCTSGGGKLFMGCTIDNLTELGPNNPFNFSSLSCADGNPVIRDALGSAGGGFTTTVVTCANGTPPPCAGPPPPPSSNDDCGTVIDNVSSLVVNASSTGQTAWASVRLKCLAPKPAPMVTVCASNLTWNISPIGGVSIDQSANGQAPDFIGLTPGTAYTASSIYNAGGTACPLSKSFTAGRDTCAAGYTLSGGVCVPCGNGTYKAAVGDGACMSCGGTVTIANATPSTYTWQTSPTTGATSFSQCSLPNPICNTGYTFTPGTPPTCVASTPSSWNPVLGPVRVPRFTAPNIPSVSVTMRETEDSSVLGRWIEKLSVFKNAFATGTSGGGTGPAGPGPVGPGESCSYDPLPSHVWNYKSSKTEVNISPTGGSALPSTVTFFDILPSSGFYDTGKDGFITNVNSLPVIADGSVTNGTTLTVAGTAKPGNGAQVAVFMPVSGACAWSYNYVGEGGNARLPVGTCTPKFAILNTRSGNYHFTVKDNEGVQKVVPVNVPKSGHSCDYMEACSVGNAGNGRTILAGYTETPLPAPGAEGLDVVALYNYGHGSGSWLTLNGCPSGNCYSSDAVEAWQNVFSYSQYSQTPSGCTQPVNAWPYGGGGNTQTRKRRCILSDHGSDIIVHQFCVKNTYSPNSSVKPCVYGGRTYYIPTGQSCKIVPNNPGWIPPTE